MCVSARERGVYEESEGCEQSEGYMWGECATERRVYMMRVRGVNRVRGVGECEEFEESKARVRGGCQREERGVIHFTCSGQL